MIILNFASITAGTYQLGDIEMFGGALYFDEIPIGFLRCSESFANLEDHQQNRV